MNEKIKKLQDMDSHWYWIPLNKIKEFENLNSKLEGLDYMDDPDGYDEFSEKFEKYRTGGDRDLKPDIFS